MATSSKRGRSGEDEPTGFSGRLRELSAQWLAANPGAAELLAGSVLADTSTQLETFSGEGQLTAREWLNRFELSRDLGQWSEMKGRSVLLAKLTGRARLWHLKHGASMPSYAEWKEKFISEHIAEQRLQSIVQNPQEWSLKKLPEEEVNVFVWRMATMAAHCGMPPDDAKAKILYGLPPEYREVLHELHSREHRDIEHLLKDIEQFAGPRRREPVRVFGIAYSVQFRWQPVPADIIPFNSVPCGRSHDFGAAYVARAMHEGCMIPGRVYAGPEAQICFNGGVYMKEDFEVLTSDIPLRWVQFEGHVLPAGAIQGGMMETGEMLYIGRGVHENELLNGYVEYFELVCHAPSRTGEVHLTEFEVLVCPTVPLA